MTDQNIEGGAPQPNGSADGPNTPPAGPTETVSRADHQRALNDMHKFKEKSRQLEADLATMRSTVDDLKKKAALAGEDYKTLYEDRDAKLKDAVADRDRIKAGFLNGEKYRAVYPALKKAGLRDDAENLIEVMDLGTIETEITTAGRVLCTGVETFVEAARTKFPYAFQKPTAPNVNGGSGSGVVAPNKWTPSTLFKLEQECKRKNDMQPHREAVQEWIKQGRPNA